MPTHLVLEKNGDGAVASDRDPFADQPCPCLLVQKLLAAHSDHPQRQTYQPGVHTQWAMIWCG